MEYSIFDDLMYPTYAEGTTSVPIGANIANEESGGLFDSIGNAASSILTGAGSIVSSGADTAVGSLMNIFSSNVKKYTTATTAQSAVSTTTTTRNNMFMYLLIGVALFFAFKVTRR